MGKKKKTNLRIGSILSGIGLGVLLGIWLNLIYSFPGSQAIYIVIGVIVLGTLGYTKQRTTEVMAYGISIYIILQFLWDYSVGDRNFVRTQLLFSSITLLIINTFSGHYYLSKPIKIFKKSLGIS